ncbi:MAG TPA: hypothetical protein VH914_10955 [Acidimicrobiia bacterium]|nr:hypothetical protein [Acidimicrobiia bacterium]
MPSEWPGAGRRSGQPPDDRSPCASSDGGRTRMSGDGSPVLEELALAEVEHNPRNNRMRAV